MGQYVFVRQAKPREVEINTQPDESLLVPIKEGGRYLSQGLRITRDSRKTFGQLCRRYAIAGNTAGQDTRLCVFTGAGVSFIARNRYRTPVWRDLLKEVYDSLAPFRIPYSRLKRRSPWSIAEYIDNNARKGALLEAMRDAIQKWPGNQFGGRTGGNKRLPDLYVENQWTLNATVAFCSVLSRILKHPCYRPNLGKIAAVLTMNYDWYLEGAATAKYETTQKSALKPMSRPASAHAATSLPVYHIHGYFPYTRKKKLHRDMSVILTTSQYKAAYGDQNSFLRKTLDRFLANHSTLFIGVSFDDRFLVGRLEALAGRPTAVPHFALLPKSGSISRRDLQKIGVAPIYYPDTNHDLVPAILGEVYKAGLDAKQCEVVSRKAGSRKTLDELKTLYWTLLLYNKK